MRPRRGSIRHILQSITTLQLSSQLRPWSRYWRFDRRRHEQATRQLSARLRVWADELDHWLDGEPQE
jgi:hypothetical protein